MNDWRIYCENLHIRPDHGHPDYWGKFAIAEEQLEDAGYVVLNPARNPEGMTPADYMRLSFAMIDCADLVALLPGAEKSAGCRLEADYCRYIGKTANTLENILRTSAFEKGILYGTTD